MCFFIFFRQSGYQFTHQIDFIQTIATPTVKTTDIFCQKKERKEIYSLTFNDLTYNISAPPLRIDNNTYTTLSIGYLLPSSGKS